MNRDEVLQTAQDTVNGPRRNTYGDAHQNFQRIADLWAQVLGVSIDADQVALCMMLVKVSRLVQTPGHTDSWVDIAGYAALGSEVATQDAATNTLMSVIPEPKTATDSVSIVLDMPPELGDKGVVDDPVLKKAGKK